MKTRSHFQWAAALALLTTATVCNADTKPIPTRDGHTLCQRELLVPWPEPEASDDWNLRTLKVVKDIARDYHCTVKFFKAPFARVEQMFVDGKSDILPLDIQSPGLEAVGTFIPYYRSHMGFVMLKRSDMPTTAEEVLADHKLRVHFLRSTVPGSFSGWGKEVDVFLADLAKDDRLGSYKDFNEGVKKLRAHHIDVMFDGYGLTQLIKEFDKTLEPVYIPTNLMVVIGWYVSNKTAPGIDREWLAELIDGYVRRSGYVERINLLIPDPRYRSALVETVKK